MCVCVFVEGGCEMRGEEFVAKRGMFVGRLFCDVVGGLAG